MRAKFATCIFCVFFLNYLLSFVLRHEEKGYYLSTTASRLTVIMAFTAIFPEISAVANL